MSEKERKGEEESEREGEEREKEIGSDGINFWSVVLCAFFYTWLNVICTNLFWQYYSDTQRAEYLCV